ncbi:MAG: hypothetical protein LZF86_20069 [Nitrospira sp.]|nr:MAG: hypothetical protein LZF86_20069 [Nitrospira sp.]
MGASSRVANSTQLVFCKENVTPDLITRLLGLIPSKSVKVGDLAEHENGYRYSSHLGIWKLDLPNASSDDPVEDQIGQWIELLQPRLNALCRLKELGYSPYLDCMAKTSTLSLCIEAELLGQLGKLNISLSIWLYEPSEAPPTP